MLDEVLGRLDLGLPRSAGPVDLREAMAECHTPGLSIARVDGGVIAETMGAGVLHTGSDAAVTERTRFQAGSISKSIAAACALRLVADGRLDLDEDVNTRLRSWRIPTNDGWTPRVSLRQLLAHTAGTTVEGYIGYPQGTPVPSLVDVLDGRGNSMPVVVAGLPGVRYRYSGGGYSVMQQLLVDVTEQDFPTLADELVLRPLGMGDSTFLQSSADELAGQAASGQAASGHHPGPVPIPGHWHSYPEMAAAGLWSTAPDLARFFLSIRASLLGERGALLPQSIAEQMATPATSARPYGLGLQVAPAGEPRLIGNDGNTQGYENHAELSVDSGQGVVVMTNGYYGRALIHQVLVPALHRAFGRQPAKPRSSSPPPGAPTRYGDFLVAPTAGGLALTYADQAPLQLSSVDDGRWSASSVNVDVWFEDGHLVVEQNGESVRY
jgi:CubicO group peptidase (beta-lactamase class C family)